jgi:superfamily II helicase
MEVKVVKKDYAFQLAQFNRRSVAIREHLIFPENTKENWHFIEFVLRRREDVGFKSHILTPVHDRGEYYEISGIVR